MKTLVFDIDNSLAAIGGNLKAKEIFGLEPIRITDGALQIKKYLVKLFDKKEVKKYHELFNEEMTDIVFEPNPFAMKVGINVIVIDTISHLFRQDMRRLEKDNKSGAMEMKDWGKLERLYSELISTLTALPVITIINSHATYDKNQADGSFYFQPAVKGATKESMQEYFDLVLYTKVAKEKKVYTWQTMADNTKFAKDRLGVLDEYVAQDFAHVINSYKKYDILYPNILVIGESGTGKTKSLTTIKEKGTYAI